MKKLVFLLILIIGSFAAQAGTDYNRHQNLIMNVVVDDYPDCEGGVNPTNPPCTYCEVTLDDAQCEANELVYYWKHTCWDVFYNPWFGYAWVNERSWTTIEQTGEECF